MIIKPAPVECEFKACVTESKTLLNGFVALAAVIVCLLTFPVSSVAGQSESLQLSRPGWYMGAGIGASWLFGMDQKGMNQETTCYPDDACFDLDPVPEVPGYRWHYDIDSDSGIAFKLFAGRVIGRTRLELSLAQRKNDINQAFRGITYGDGTLSEPRPNTSVVGNSETSADDLTVQTVSLNAYYDFPDLQRRFSPYLGGGLGVAFTKLSGLKFSADYEDTSGASQTSDPPLSFYNSRQDVNLYDNVFIWHLHAGIDYSLSDKTLLGLKLSYSMMDDIKDQAGYSLHPFHAQNLGLTSQTTFGGGEYWTLVLTLKRRFEH